MARNIVVEQPSIPEPLTKRQKEVLDILTQSIVSFGQPPTIRELGEELGLSSPASVHRHLSILGDKGYISFRKASYSVSVACRDEEIEHAQLTDFEEKVLRFVTARASRRGVSPTIREIVETLKETSSLGRVHSTLRSLERKGYVYLKEGQAYSIALVPPSENTRYPVSVGKVPSDADTFLPEKATEVMWLPLALLIESFEYSDAGSIFVVRAADNSMSGVGILEGDYVLVRRQDKAANGDIVVAEYMHIYMERGKSKKGNWVILRSYERKAEDTHPIYLEPANKQTEAIRARDDEVSILGVGVGLFRRGFKAATTSRQ